MSIIITAPSKSEPMSKTIQLTVASEALRLMKCCAIEQNTTLTQVSHNAWLDYLEKHQHLLTNHKDLL
jgi:hypothetical protein